MGMVDEGRGAAVTYIDQYRQLHSAENYGATSHKKAPFIVPHIRVLAPRSVIDYGCGQSTLPELIEAAGAETVRRYDPAIPAYSKRPEPGYDLLVSVDVLEHIPESALDDVLSDMRSLAKHALLIIDTEEAVKVLPNGENAHATLKPHRWWRRKLAEHFGPMHQFHCIPLTRACFKTWHTPLLRHAAITSVGIAGAARRRIARAISYDARRAAS
jgi:hypothetical protein